MSRLGKISLLFSGLSLVSFALVRYMVGDWVPFCWVALGLSVFFVGFTFFIDRKFFAEFFSMKTTKHGMSMGAMILLVVTLLVIINFIGVRKYKVFDFSISQSNTLSEQSIKLLKALDSDLKVRFFYKKGVEGNEENRKQFRELIKKYQDQSDKVVLDFVEVNERPDLASDFGVDKGSGVVFMEYKGKRNRIDKIEEQDISSALVKVTRATSKVIYFTTGHGEKSLDEVKDASGLNALKMLLESNNYTVKTVALSQASKVPDDADLVVVAGPKQDFMDFEIKAVEEYLKKGGSMMLALDSQQTMGLEKITSKLGVAFDGTYIWNLIETPLGKAVNQGPAFGAIYSSTSEITKAFGRDEAALFIHPTSLRRLEKVPTGVVIDDIVRTPAASVSYKTLQIKEEGGIQGPFTIASEIKGKFPGADDSAKSFSLILVGDSNFMNNQLLFKNLNRDLLLNSVAWLAKEEGLISISPKETQKTELTLTPVKFSLFLFGIIIPIPVLMLVIATTLWMKRRNA